MNVLVACEYSATVRDAFASRGHNAWSVDLLPCDKEGKHRQGDILEMAPFLPQPSYHRWDLLIAHPPCAFLTNSGVRWLWKDKSKGLKNLERWENLDKAAKFFRRLLESNIPRICIENPIMHGHGIQRVGRKYDQIVQPYQFGHRETKATCFWLKGLKPLKHTTDYKEETMALPKNIRGRIHYVPPSKDRWKIRSTTYVGIAEAMAQQWGV